MLELKGRKLIILLGVPFGIICYYFGNPAFAILMTFIMLIGLDEFYNMCEKKNAFPNRIFGFIATMLISLSYSGVYAHHQITIMGLICLGVISVFFIELINNKKEPLLNVGVTFLGILSVPCVLGTLIHLRQMDHIYNSNLVFTIFISVWLCDTSAFFFGSAFGEKKIAPHISPKKSWVGSVTGLFSSVLVFFIAWKISFLGSIYNYSDAIIFGLISGIFSQIGDFSVSMLKRDTNVKDSGKILFGHGGILDRFDSLLFSAPLFYIYLLIFLNK